MANYLHVCLAPAARTCLTNLRDSSISSWAELCRQFTANFQAIFDKPGNHWELARIKQRDWEPLREYIQHFCRVKNTIPNISDAQVVTAFQGGLRDDDLIKKIGRLDAAGDHPWIPKGSRKDADKVNEYEDKEEFQNPEHEVNYIYGRSTADLKRKQKILYREVDSVSPAVDGGSSLDILFMKTFKELSIPLTHLKPSRSPFHGVIPGIQTVPLGQITLPVTFGTRENYKTERITFEVADLDSTYHAIIGRPAIAKFMAIPHYLYMMMKLPVPNGVILLCTDVQTSYDYNNRSCELTKKEGGGIRARRAEGRDCKGGGGHAPLPPPPPNKTLKATVQAEAMESKKIHLDNNDVSKTTNVGVNLGDK
ncbi:hypothetical protein QOZ80_UnG0720520 [Eleusine coracana subsp. coracana]|uniref:Retrotransposon gag domain-containing protein n=1 Tax=Eleusine coracana subsp. coracana TaxID=191504 RepID=A0AAV9FW27_ELECO|nr:hypothetical protein QOZ80_UnG0720520 [Eleusine coracana subsp. coracana]